ncbi:MAG: EamA family transporter, partial [Clostridia bacterium]|nr:EamA family transporter [Clostridia bacterium]
MQNQKNNDIIFSKAKLAFSMAVFGTIGIFVRSIPFPSSFIAMTRGFAGVAFLLFLNLIRRKRIDFAAVRKNLPVLFLSGAAIGVNWILLFEAYNYTSVATATLCYYLAPIFVTLASPFVLKEK